MTAKIKMKSRKELQTLFREIDVDGSGELDIYEVIGLAEKLGITTPPEEIGQMFREIDTNGDGMVSFDEFVSWYRLGANSSLKNYLKSQLRAQNDFRKLKDKYTPAGNSDGINHSNLLLDLGHLNPRAKFRFTVEKNHLAADKKFAYEKIKFTINGERNSQGYRLTENWENPIIFDGFTNGEEFMVHVFRGDKPLMLNYVFSSDDIDSTTSDNVYAKDSKIESVY